MRNDKGSFVKPLLCDTVSTKLIMRNNFTDAKVVAVFSCISNCPRFHTWPGIGALFCAIKLLFYAVADPGSKEVCSSI